MDEELAFEHAANRAYEHYRQTGRRSDGRRFGKRGCQFFRVS
jgi:hypothetical protein